VLIIKEIIGYDLELTFSLIVVTSAELILFD
jgi:hypothetical protein